MKKIWLQEMKWKEVKEYLKIKDIVLVPIGSCEQHGPAGPLGFDTYIANGICESIAKRMDVLISPPMWFGDSSHHLGFAGTISIRSEVLIEYLKEVIRSLLKHGFKKIIFINGHRIANIPAIKIAAQSIKEFENREAIIAIIDPSHIGSGGTNFKEADEHHAGEVETSQLLYINPTLIDESNLPITPSKFKKYFSEFSKNCIFEKSPVVDVIISSEDELTIAKETNGAMADASKANIEKGKKFHQYVVDNSCKFVYWLENNFHKNKKIFRKK